MIRKTAGMQLVEHQQGEQLETLLPRLFLEHKTQGAVASYLGVTITTLQNWLTRMGAVRVIRCTRSYEVSFPSATEGG